MFWFLLLTCTMEQDPSWEANWFPPSQKIPHIYGTQRFITTFTSANHLSLSFHEDPLYKSLIFFILLLVSSSSILAFRYSFFLFLKYLQGSCLNIV